MNVYTTFFWKINFFFQFTIPIIIFLILISSIFNIFSVIGIFFFEEI